jgi:membrane associated rhomboid family serine protease
MGIENRDYVRRGSGGAFDWGAAPNPAVQGILAITIAMWVLQLALRRDFEFWLKLYPAQATDLFRPWQVVTYGFLHAVREPLHIVCNMIGLWMFGRWMEDEKGSREFTAFYLFSLVFGAAGHLAYAYWGAPAAAVGASGAIMAIIGWAAVTYPRREILVMFVIPMQLRFAAILFIALDALGAGPNISHGAHLGGIAFGLAYARFGWRLAGWTGSPGGWVAGAGRSVRRRLRRQPPLKVFTPEAEPPRNVSPTEAELQARVDAILAKVSVEGEAALTADERAVLVAAADVYKRKRRPLP